MSKTERTSEDFFEIINNSTPGSPNGSYQPPAEIAELRAAILKDYSAQVFYESEGQGTPVSYKYASEKALTYYITSGNISKIQAIIQEMNPSKNRYDPAYFVDIGLLSDNPLQQATSMYVCGITIYTRAAIDGGLPEHMAYALSDNYIRHGLRLTNIEELYSIQNCAIYDFTNQVYQYKYRNCGLHVKKCCEYILRHLHEKITLEDLSEVTNKSTGYISKKFEDELGMRPTIFIRNQKLEYAAQALKATSVPVTALSDLLAFPSPSAFIGYFKEKYNMTPLEYRNS